MHVRYPHRFWPRVLLAALLLAAACCCGCNPFYVLGSATTVSVYIPLSYLFPGYTSVTGQTGQTFTTSPVNGGNGVTTPPIGGFQNTGQLA